MKFRSSMPNVTDTRSDVSGFTSRSGGSRLLHRTCDLYQESMDIAQVTANFRTDHQQTFPVPRPPARTRGSTLSLATDPGDRRTASSVPKRRASSVAGEGYSHIVERYVAHRQYPKHPQNRIDVNSFKHDPLMLLPKVRPTVQTDMYSFMNRLKDNTVIAADPLNSVLLSTANRASSAVSSMSQVSTDLDEDVQDTDDSGYIDSFVNLREVKKRRKDTLRDKFEAKLRRKREEAESQKALEPGCPRCQALYDAHGGKNKFLDWFWGRWEGEKTNEPFDSEVEENIRKSRQPHFCNFVKKIDLIGKNTDDANSPVVSRRSRRSRGRTPASEQGSSDTPIRVWLGDEDDDISTGPVGRVVEASSTISDSSLVDAASMSQRLRGCFRIKSRTTLASGGEDVPEEVSLEEALQAIRSSSIKFTSDIESDSSSLSRTSNEKKSSGSRSRRSKSSRPKSAGEGSDYSSGSESEFSEGGTRYSREKSSSRAKSATIRSGHEADEQDEAMSFNTEKEEEEEETFGNDELYTLGEDHMEEAILSFKYYEKKHKEPSIPADRVLDEDLPIAELTEDQIEQIAYRNGIESGSDSKPEEDTSIAIKKVVPDVEQTPKKEPIPDPSSLAMSGWTGNSAWKKPVKRYALPKPVEEPASVVDLEEEVKKPVLGARPVFSKRRETVHDPNLQQEEERKRAAYVVAALPDARFRTRGSGLWGKEKKGTNLFDEELEEELTPPSLVQETDEVTKTEESEKPPTPEVPPLPEIPEPEPEKPKKKKKIRKTHSDMSEPKKKMGEKLDGDYTFSFNFNDMTSTMDNERKKRDRQNRDEVESLSSYSTTSFASTSSSWSGCARQQEEVIDIEHLILTIKTEEEEKARMQSWLAGRLALSQQASRFELPMDMKRLETMSPEEYLSQFCVISSRRSTLYNKVFSKYKDKQGKIGMKDLDKALQEVLINTITSEEIQTVLRLTTLEDNSKINSKLFSGLAAMAERLLYPKYVTDDTVDIPDHKKEKIEAADFSALKWKFDGVEVNSAVKKLLESL